MIGYILLIILVIIVLYLLYKCCFEVSGHKGHQHLLKGQDAPIEVKKDEYKKAINEISNQKGTRAADFFVLNKIIDDPDIIDDEYIIFGAVEAYHEALEKEIPLPLSKKKESLFIEDKQNVHDSLMSIEMRNQFLDIKEEVKNYEAPDLILTLVGLQDDRVNKVLIELERGGNIRDLGQEWDIFEIIWKKACQVGAQQAYIDSIKDCVENGIPVCAIGRFARIISSLAGFDGNYGHLPTLDSIKSELLDSAGLLYEQYGEDFEKYETLIKEKIKNDYPHLPRFHDELISMCINIE